MQISFHRLFPQPLVAICLSGELGIAAAHAARIADGRPAYLLAMISWAATPDHVAQVRSCVDTAAAAHPNLRVVLLASTPAAEGVLQAAGFDTVLANHNAFLDERLFFPVPDTPKRFGAVYNARLVPWKRHDLAAGVPRLAVISGGYAVDPQQARERIQALPNLAWTNWNAETGDWNKLLPWDVRSILVRSHCGLCLSAVEGAMFASGEYLLCGLPVVTTPSDGGRDAFFEDGYVATVEPEVEAVAAAAARFREKPPDPLRVRRRTLELMREHRRRLLQRLSEIVGYDLVEIAGPSLWAPQFINRFARLAEVQEPAATVGEAATA